MKRFPLTFEMKAVQTVLLRFVIIPWKSTRDSLKWLQQYFNLNKGYFNYVDTIFNALKY